MINMDGRKDISDMSFEEFFSKKDNDADVPEVPVKPIREKKVDATASDKDVKRGFVMSGPKLNFKDGSIVLYIPRYSGGENDRFETAIEYKGDVIPTGRLNASRQRGTRVTSATTISLEPLEVSPFAEFRLTIDGIGVYDNRARPVLYFNASGLPIGRANGHVFAIRPSSVSLRGSKAELLSEKECDGLTISEYDVSLAGGLWLDDGSDKVAEPVMEPCPTESPKVPAPKKEVKTQTKVKKVKPKVTITLSTPVADAEIMCCGETIPLFREMPTYRMDYEGCEQDDCIVVLKDANGNDVAASDREGYVSVSVLHKDKEVSRAAFFIIPDFDCTYSGKGDIPDDPAISFTLFGESYDMTVYDDGVRGPFSHNNVAYEVHWKVPSVMWDLGAGPVPLEPQVMNIDDLSSPFMVVTVRGAKKKKLYFGPEKGKKRDLSPEWVGDSITVDLNSIKAEIFAAGNVSYCFYISVNSFPNRKFLTVNNPPRMTAKFVDGNIEADISVSGVDCVCRMYKMDKSTFEVPLVFGHNVVPIPEDVIEAEVLELYNGSVRISIPVTIRQLPFITRELGDYWMYVSKDKRIPLPSGLIKDGVADMNEVKQWHSRITRMNPELKNVTLAMMQKAFSVI